MKQITFQMNATDAEALVEWLVNQQFCDSRIKWKKENVDPVRFTILAPIPTIQKLYIEFLEQHNFLR